MSPQTAGLPSLTYAAVNGLTAWDTQKLRRTTLSLYLDMVNLFLFILRLFSGRRRS